MNAAAIAISPSAYRASIRHLPSPTAQFTGMLKAGYCPTAEELHDLCTALHASMVDCDAPELLWMDRNFEDMADSITRALRCVDREEV
jgi:hypothetical protein